MRPSFDNQNEKLALESTDLVEVHGEHCDHKVPDVADDFEKVTEQICDYVGEEGCWVDVLDDEGDGVGHFG